MQLSLTDENLKQLIEKGKERIRNHCLILVLDEVGQTKKIDPQQPDTDFFSQDEVEEFERCLTELKAKYRIFTLEDEFANAIVNHHFRSDNQLIWNLTRQGAKGNKKSLVTAMADFYCLSYIGSSVETMNVCRDKFKFQKIIDNIGPSIRSYDETMRADFAGSQWFIEKNSSGSASIGLTDHSIRKLTTDGVNKILANHPGTMLEQFIPGYEVEVPIFKLGGMFKSLGPVGLTINRQRFLKDTVLTETRSETYDYTFYDLYQELSNSKFLDADKIVSQINYQACEIAQRLELENYGRIDFRIDDKGNAFCFDIATTPYFVRHSSLCYAFLEHQLSQSELMLAIIGSED